MWHGAGWTFLLWGLLHGLCMCISRAVSTLVGERFEFATKDAGKINEHLGLGKLLARKVLRGIMIAFTIALTLCLLAVFRAESLKQAGLIFANVFGQMADKSAWKFNMIPLAMLKEYQIPEFFYVLKLAHLNADSQIPILSCFGLIFFGMILVLFTPNTVELTKNFKASWIKSFIVALLIIWCLVSLSQVSTFLYFDF